MARTGAGTVDIRNCLDARITGSTSVARRECICGTCSLASAGASSSDTGRKPAESLPSAVPKRACLWWEVTMLLFDFWVPKLENAYRRDGQNTAVNFRNGYECAVGGRDDRCR